MSWHYNRYSRFSKSFLKNERGVEEYHLRILIIAIVLVITVPIIVYSLDYYATIQQENEMGREVERVSDAITQVSIQGAGASMSIEVKLPKETDYVKIGGDLRSPLNSTIRYKLTDEHEKLYVVKNQNRGIPITGDSDKGTEGVTIGGRKSQLVIEKIIDENDLDGDGNRSEYYILVTVL